MKAFWLSLIMVCFVTAASWAQSAEVPADTQVIDTRTEEISKTLRCVVCQNQSIYDSNAPLAEDMRRLVRKRVEAGDSDDEVRDYLRDRYGDYVLMTPPLQMNTILLWAGPVILFLLGGIWYLRRVRTAPSTPAPQDLTEQDRARIAVALANEDP